MVSESLSWKVPLTGPRTDESGEMWEGIKGTAEIKE